MADAAVVLEADSIAHILKADRQTIQFN